MKTSIFEIGKTYNMKYIGDSQMLIQWTVIKRTAKTIQVQDQWGETMQKRIKFDSYSNSEFIEKGSYSMAPVLYAKNIQQ